MLVLSLFLSIYSRIFVASPTLVSFGTLAHSPFTSVLATSNSSSVAVGQPGIGFFVLETDHLCFSTFSSFGSLKNTLLVEDVEILLHETTIRTSPSIIFEYTNIQVPVPPLLYSYHSFGLPQNGGTVHSNDETKKSFICHNSSLGLFVSTNLSSIFDTWSEIWFIALSYCLVLVFFFKTLEIIRKGIAVIYSTLVCFSVSVRWFGCFLFSFLVINDSSGSTDTIKCHVGTIFWGVSTDIIGGARHKKYGLFKRVLFFVNSDGFIQRFGHSSKKVSLSASPTESDIDVTSSKSLIDMALDVAPFMEKTKNSLQNERSKLFSFLWLSIIYFFSLQFFDAMGTSSTIMQ